MVNPIIVVVVLIALVGVAYFIYQKRKKSPAKCVEVGDPCMLTADCCNGICPTGGGVCEIPKCVMSDWSDWSACDATCGGGTERRTRTVILNTGNCDDTEEVRPCGTGPCPVDCVVGDWSEWGQCSTGCGGGTQTRGRSIVTDSQNGGADCPVLTDSAGCNEQPCPIDCVMSDWTSWSSCDATCGGGQSERTRTVITQPQFNGRECDATIETTGCNEQSCPIDCVVSDWSDWSGCSTGCGGGTQTRTRYIVTDSQNGGAACPVLIDSTGCNSQPCAIDCQMSDWTQWSSCDATCGGG